MAQIDVSELMTDPDFVDPIVLIDRRTVVNSQGENLLQEFCTDTIGSVQPASAKTLMRLPEALRLEDISSFWIKGVITATAPGLYAAVLVFKGRRFQVKSVSDWSNFGQGYTEGICVAELPS